MSTNLVVNGTSYAYPDTGDQNWGTVASAWAAAVTSGMLQKAGGSFTLTADANFGTNFGLLSPYFTSSSANPSSSGVFRLASGEALSWRNNANSANLSLSVNASDQLTFNGVVFFSGGGVFTDTTFSIQNSTDATKKIAFSAASISTATTRTITMPDANVNLGSLTNSNISSSAAIAYSKLALTGSILNADINSSAAIAYSKLALTGAILNADLAGSIAYSKLSLTGAILNADLAGSIAASKLVGSDIATIGTVTTGTWSASTIAVNKGGTGVTAVTTAPAASAWAGWDANKNLSANSLLEGYATTATAAGTTALVVGSSFQQYFTGSTTQTVTMPVASTLVAGQQYQIINLSSGVVTVQSSGANTIQAMAANTQLTLTCISTSGTGTASWSWAYQTVQNTLSGGGTVTSVAATVPSILSIAGSPVTTSGTLAFSYSGTPLPKANGGTGSTTYPGDYYATVYYPASTTHYWTNANSTITDYAVVGGTMTSPSTYVNSNFGTISKATSDLPGINFSAPRTGVIRMVATVTANENNAAAQRDWAVFLHESTTSTLMASAIGQSSSLNATSGIKVVTLTGYFSATASTTYNFKIQSLISGNTLYLYSASTAGSMLSFQMDYIS